MQLIVASTLVLLMRFFTGLRATWIDCEPSLRQRVYFANHSSHLDGLVIWAALPKQVRQRTRPVAAKDYWGSSRLRRYLAKHVFNAILIERDGSKPAQGTIDEIVSALGDKYSLIFFPEGTRGNGTEVGSFRSGLYHIARSRPDIELVPVYLENLSRVLPKGEILPVPVLGSATFGCPIQLGGEEPKADFIERARDTLVSLKGSA